MSAYNSRRWEDARRAALARDDRRCRDCGRASDLHVHHIRPVRTFESPEGAHYLDNLVTLCKYCHPKWEGRPGTPDHAVAKIGLKRVVTDLLIDTILNTMTDDVHERVFDKFLIGNPTVCSSCLRRVYDVDPRPIPKGRQHLNWISNEEWFPSKTASVDYPPPSGEQWERPANAGASTICECGEFGDYGGRCEALEGSVSKERMIELGQRVVARLEEEGVLLNEDAFYSLIREAKSRSELQGVNFDIMRRAVGFGIKKSNRTVRGSPGIDCSEGLASAAAADTDPDSATGHTVAD